MTPRTKSLLILTIFLLGLSACQSAAEPVARPTGFQPYQIVFVGDILLGDAAQPMLDENGYDWPFLFLEETLAGDFLIGNGEGPITILEQPWDPDQRWSYNAQPQSAQALAAAGFDALGYSNNHALDRGPDGLADSIAVLAENGISVFGAGPDQDQAAAPLLFETPYGKVAIVALSENWGADRTAGENQAGSIALSSASIRAGYRLAKQAGAEWVVAYVHWGTNYAEVERDQRKWATEFIEAGYDLIIGHGAHSLQQIELIDGIPVFYSLGNFVFNTPGRFTDEFPGFGLAVSAALGPNGFYQAQLRCIQTDNLVVGYQPRPCTPEQAIEVFASLNPELSIQEGTALLTW